MEVLSFMFCSLLLATQVLQDITSFFSSCLVIFVTRGAVTCCILHWPSLMGWICQGHHADGVDPASLSLGHQVGFFLSGWRLGADIYRQSSSGCSRSQMLSMVQDKNVHLLAKPWVGAA